MDNGPDIGLAAGAFTVNVVLGARGRLGHAIAASSPLNQTLTPERFTYFEWWREGGADRASRYLEGLRVEPGVVYVAAGIIDPSRPVDEHENVNYQLAKDVVEGATRLGFRVLTFGTVMEKLIADDSKNPYYSSKKKLGRFVEDFAPRSGSALHVRIHTLFGGGPPEGFMFLGQMFRALVDQVEFRMSPGTQLREDHHLDDEVQAIFQLARGQAGGSIDLSHGEPVALRDMADYVFRAFGCPWLLKAGALPGPAADNFGVVFKRTSALGDISFRPTLPAVVDYLQHCRNLPSAR